MREFEVAADGRPAAYLAAIEAARVEFRAKHGEDPLMMFVCMTPEDWQEYLASDVQFPKWAVPVFDDDELADWLTEKADREEIRRAAFPRLAEVE